MPRPLRQSLLRMNGSALLITTLGLAVLTTACAQTSQRDGLVQQQPSAGSTGAASEPYRDNSISEAASNLPLDEFFGDPAVSVIGLAVVGKEGPSRYATADGGRPALREFAVLTPFTVTMEAYWKGEAWGSTSVVVDGGRVGQDVQTATRPRFLVPGARVVVVLGPSGQAGRGPDLKAYEAYQLDDAGSAFISAAYAVPSDDEPIQAERTSAARDARPEKGVKVTLDKLEKRARKADRHQ